MFMAAGLEALKQSGKLHKPKIVGYKGGLKLVCCCPFHQDSTPSFVVFDSGVYHCAGCGVCGRVVRKDGSGDDLLSHLGITGGVPLQPVPKKTQQHTELEPALLHRAYQAALGALQLRRCERQHLIDRGLSLEDMTVLEANGYRSAPTAWPLRNAVAEAVLAAVGPNVARSLPFLQPSQRSPIGFICSEIPGLLIPVRNAAGQIVACKVRLVDQGKSRYLWWKARHSSASTGAPIHVSQTPSSRLAIVVEGPIKADLVGLRWAQIYGEAVTVLAIPGASAHGGLTESLQQLGLTRVLLALDLDTAGRKASQDLQPRLERAGLTVETVSWPEDFGKIDDFLTNKSAPHDLLVRTFSTANEEKAPVEEPFATMEEARAAARPWLQAALTGPRDSVHHMALEMGGGKTHLAVELVNELYESGKLKGQVGLFTTRHEQGEQFEATTGWARHYGATYGFENGEPTAKSPCKEPQRMLTVVNTGAPTKLACELCPQRAACSSNFARDPDQPFLLAQKATSKERHLYNANSLRDPSVVRKLSTLILDDLDLERTLVDHVLLDIDQLKKALLWSERDPEYAPMRPLLKALWGLLPSIPAKRFSYDAPRINGEALQDALAAELGGLDHLRKELEQAVTAKDPHPLNAGDVRADIPHRGFVKLAQRLAEELRQRGQNTWNPMVHLKAEGISLWTRARVDFTGKTVILLNAGNSAEQYQRLFPGATVHRFAGRVVMPERTRVAQIPVGPYTLKGVSQLVEIVSQTLQDRQLQHPDESPSDWGLVANSEIRQTIENHFPGINARHYGNQTGSNEMESVKFLVVAGDFKPNPHGFLEEAQALWGDSPRLEATSRVTRAQIQDKTGKALTRGRRGYLDPRLDARWLELTAGEVRQAVGRGRPWNTGQHQAEQGDLFQDGQASARHLDVLLLSSYALEGITPDQLSGERADLEDVLTRAAVQLRRSGQVVTLTSLRAKTGISDRQIRERFNRVKLRSEGEFMALSAASYNSLALNLGQAILTATESDRPDQDWTGPGMQRRGPPAKIPSRPSHPAAIL